MINDKLIKGKYLKYAINACFGRWLIVFDGMYNWMLFDATIENTKTRFKTNRLPSNKCGRKATVAYYSTFDNALKGLGGVINVPASGA